MESKTKECQCCKASFTIDVSDFEFYERIDVPEPTFCPECRLKRRFIFRNERHLYKRKCDFSGEEVFSCFLPEAPVKMYDSEIWWSDKWDATEFGRDYDFNRPFFQQFAELLKKTPLPSRTYINLVNSDYCMNAGELRDCYLVFNSGNSESCSYGVEVDLSKDSVDNYGLTKCELCHQGFMLINCYQVLFSSHCENCQEIIFCKNCVGCSNCFGCSNLRHKKYHIFNRPYSKEEYKEKTKELDIGSFKKTEELKEKTRKHHLKYPVKFIKGRKNNGVTGDYIYNCKNVKDSYSMKNAENVRFGYLIRFKPSAKDCYDQCGIGKNTELSYENMIVGRNASKIKFCYNSYENIRELEYCLQCISSSNLFGCVSMRKKQYCILNKQYTKEEYKKLIPKIKQHMNDMPYVDKKGRVYKYGEYFPPEFSPLAYNETPNQEHFPLTKKEAIEQGYRWYDKPKSEHKPTIKARDLPDNIKDVDETILKEVIECAHESDKKEECQGAGALKIIPSELEFYQKLGLSLPRLCPECRHIERIKQRNSMRLYERQCQCNGTHSENKVYQNQSSNHADHPQDQPCPNKFQTTYAPDRKEIVYCEDCYLKEVE